MKYLFMNVGPSMQAFKSATRGGGDGKEFHRKRESKSLLSHCNNGFLSQWTSCLYYIEFNSKEGKKDFQSPYISYKSRFYFLNFGLLSNGSTHCCIGSKLALFLMK